MKTAITCLLALICYVQYSESRLQNLLGTPMHKCIECLCHARTGCYRRVNCASYSISYDYWKVAGYPTLDGDDPGKEQSYRRCIRDENCILNTIVGYTDTFNKADCNCDGTYDCQDMLKLHLYGEQCGSIMDQTQVQRFNNCARMNGLSQMTSNNFCEVDAQ